MIFKVDQLLETQLYDKKLTQNYQSFSEKNDKIIKKLFEQSINNNKIKVNFKELVNIVNGDFATHRIHKYPAKIIPHIPQLFVRNSILSSPGDLVCDPFCGTGTVLLESMLGERNSIGIELNPVSKLISKVKTTPIDPSKLLYYFSILKQDFTIKEKIECPDFCNIDYWFSEKIKVNLTRIFKSINYVIPDRDIQDFFLVCFSSIIRKVSKADPKISQPVYSKYMRENYNPKKINVFEIFTKQVFANINRMEELFLIRNKDIKSSIIEGDSRKIKLKNNFQLIITSPPYLNAQEYFRSTRLEFYWLGMNKKWNINSLMKQSVGPEGIRKLKNPEINEIGIKKIDSIIKKISEKSKTRAYVTYRYFDDLIKVIDKMERVLERQGYFILVIGNNEICNVKIPSNEIISKAAALYGLEIKMELIDEIKSYGLMTKRNNSSGIINKESILVMTK